MGGITFGFILVAHVVVGIAIVGFVLMQHGKGADMGAAFGSGSSGSLFGSSGSANFLSRTTAVLATIFFATSLVLTYMANSRHAPKSLMEGVVTQSAPSASSAPLAKDEQEVPK